MYHFLRMVEHVKTYGIGATNAPAHKFYNELKEMFFGLVEKNNVFIFQPTGYTPTSIVDMTPDRKMDFSSPFDVISIECAGQENSLIYSSKSKEQIAEGESHALRINCIMYFDIADDIFVHYSLHDDTGKEVEAHVAYCSNTIDNNFKTEMVATLSVYINKLNVEKTGLERVNEKVKIKTKEGNKFHKISQVIYVSPSKTYFKSLSEGSGRTIDYSHRFFRRGHWRKTQQPTTLGKDRHGARNQYGRTWVLESEVGDKNLPLITKTRVVREEKTN